MLSAKFIYHYPELGKSVCKEGILCFLNRSISSELDLEIKKIKISYISEDENEPIRLSVTGGIELANTTMNLELRKWSRSPHNEIEYYLLVRSDNNVRSSHLGTLVDFHINNISSIVSNLEIEITYG